jgi:Tol biopolymer transport system component
VFLPDGSALFIAHASDGEPGLYVHVDGGTALLRRLPADLEFGRLHYGGGGWLVADAGGRAEPALWAIPFDASRVRSEGDPVRVLPGARSPTMSDEGALVYVDAEVFSSDYDVVWVSREGTVQETVRPSEARRPLGAPLISPDGQRMALVVADNDSGDSRGARGASSTRSLELLVYDFATPGAPILLYAGAEFGLVGWFPDSQHVVVALSGEDGVQIVAMPLEGDGQPVPVATARAGRGRGGLVGSNRPTMTPGGERLVFLDTDGVAQMITIARDGTVGAPQPLVAEGVEGNGGFTVSPDGRLAATSSGGSVESTLALTRLPAGTPTFPLATNARSPRWSRDGSELFFYQQSTVATAYILAVNIDLAAGRPTGAPVQLFPTTVGPRQYLLSSFDVTADGSRFLMVLLRQPPTRHVLIEDFDAFMQARRR